MFKSLILFHLQKKMTKRTKKISNASKIRSNIMSQLNESKIVKQRPKCFNCNSQNHILSKCPLQSKCPKCNGDHKNCDSKTFVCFHCKKVGHLSKDCEENPNGIYKYGGSCHLCQSVRHLSRDCDQRGKSNQVEKPVEKKVKVVVF